MYLVSGSLWDWGPLALLWCGADALVWYELLVGTLVGPSGDWSCPPSIPTWCDIEGDWSSCSLGGKGYWLFSLLKPLSLEWCSYNLVT